MFILQQTGPFLQRVYKRSVRQYQLRCFLGTKDFPLSKGFDCVTNRVKPSIMVRNIGRPTGGIFPIDGNVLFHGADFCSAGKIFHVIVWRMKLHEIPCHPSPCTAMYCVI